MVAFEWLIAVAIVHGGFPAFFPELAGIERLLGPVGFVVQAASKI